MDPWNQVNAGLELMASSGLASWSVSKSRLEAATDSSKFEAHAAAVNANFGRLICWITFSAGVEYLVRGVFSMHGKAQLKPKLYLPPIGVDQELGTWLNLAQSKSNWDSGQEHLLKLGGNLAWENILISATDLELRTVHLSIFLFMSTIRNRDFHEYVEGKRLNQFYLIQKLFVPAINIILGHLDQTKLKNH